MAAVAAGLLLSSCTSSTGVPPLELAIASAAEESAASENSDNALSSGQSITLEATATEPSEDAVQTQAADEKPVETVAASEAEPKPETDVAETPEKPEGTVTETTASAVTPEPAAQTELVVINGPTEVAPDAKKRRNFLSSLWSSRPAAEVPVKSSGEQNELKLASAAPAAEKKPAARVVRSSFGGGEALPGVRDENKLFEIKRKSGLEDDSDIDINEDDGSYRVASAAGLARLAPNGLMTQREGVDVACLKPSLVRVLKKVERHYGQRVVVTSGYRSPAYNRRARGARNSLHMYCAAADIQVEGVTKWELAKYLRSMPGRGGVGTYCHTKSVHVDVGPERDWNWRCRRGKKRRR